MQHSLIHAAIYPMLTFSVENAYLQTMDFWLLCTDKLTEYAHLQFTVAESLLIIICSVVFFPMVHTRIYSEYKDPRAFAGCRITNQHKSSLAFLHKK